MFYAMNGVHPSYHLMKARDKRASECFRLNMTIFRALTIHAIENVPMNDTLTTEQAAKVREYNDVVDYIKSLNIDIDKVLHFRASCLHTTNVAQIKKACIFVQANNIVDLNVFFHLSFSENFILVEDDEWKIILERIATEGIPEKAMNTGGFWSKILVEDDKWEIILEWIATEGIPEKAMNTDGFWSNILEKDDKWEIILERIATEGIPEKVMNTGG